MMSTPDATPIAGSDVLKKECFVIAPIGTPDSDERKRSDKVFRHVIKPAVEPCGYEAYRGDHETEPGVILTTIVRRLLQAPLVIADLSGRNPNVFYELAVRHTFRKPVILLMQQGEAVPFDVGGLRIITLDHTDLDNVESVKRQIGDQIRAIESGGNGFSGSPIEVAVQLDELSRTATPESTSRAEVIQSLAKMREWMTAFQTDILKTLGDLQKVLIPHFEARRGGVTGIVTQQEFEQRRTAEMNLRVADNFLTDNDLRLAGEYYERVLAVFPDDHMALIGKGKVLKRRAAAEKNLGLLHKAISVLTDCITKHPVYERAYYNRACYRCIVGDPEDIVLADLDRAIKLFGGYRDLARRDEDFRRIAGSEAFANLVKVPDLGA
jgi:hypothetical protein